MAEPLLNLGDIGLMRERVGSRGGAQRMHAQPIDFGADAGLQAVMAHDVAVDRGGIEGSVQFFLRPVIPDRAEQGTGRVAGVAGERQVFLDEPLRHCVRRHKPHLAALALDAEVQDALTALHILHPQGCTAPPGACRDRAGWPGWPGRGRP